MRQVGKGRWRVIRRRQRFRSRPGAFYPGHRRVLRYQAAAAFARTGPSLVSPTFPDCGALGLSKTAYGQPSTFRRNSHAFPSRTATAVRSAGSRSRGWAVIMSRSCWTGGWSSRWWRTAGAAIRRHASAGAGDGDGAGAAEGDRQGIVQRRVHRDAADGAVRRGAEHELAGDRAGPARRGDLARDFGEECAQAGELLAPLAGAIAERNRDSWHLHADETTWRVFAPGTGTARRSGGCGCSSARTPSLRDGSVPVRARAGPARRH